MSILEFRDVTASYGPFRALFGVWFEVAKGEAVALLGTNGAGKTTVAGWRAAWWHPPQGACSLTARTSPVPEPTSSREPACLTLPKVDRCSRR